MARHHGITADTYKRLILDSGAAYTGWTDMATPGTLLGATKGGSQLTIEQEIKNMEVDGARGPVVGSRRITMVKVSLTVNFIEHTLENLKRLIVGSASAIEEVNWNKITRSLAIVDGDFLSNIALIGEVSGDSDGVGVVLDNCICDSNFELSFADKEEGVIAATFTGHFDPSDLDTEPWAIIWPDPDLPVV